MDRDGLQHAVWRALVDAGEPVSTQASMAAADAVLVATAQGIAQAEIEAWAPPPRPLLMVELHEEIPWRAWSDPDRLAAALERYATRLRARSEDRHAA